MPPKKRKRNPLEIEEDATYVDVSTIPGAGKGMFATRDLPAEKKLGRYIGKMISWEEANNSKDKTYHMYNKPGYVVDGAQLDNKMRWANHSVDAKKKRPNAEARIYSNGSVIFHTLRPIKAKEEIFIDYGYDPAEK